MRLVQYVCETREIPRQMLWMVVVLIPKGSLGDFSGIGLLEVIWKLIEWVIDKILTKIGLHDCLHSFRAKRDCGTGIIETKLVQQLAYCEQYPLYGIFLDLKRLARLWIGNSAWTS